MEVWRHFLEVTYWDQNGNNNLKFPQEVVLTSIFNMVVNSLVFYARSVRNLRGDGSKRAGDRNLP